MDPNINKQVLIDLGRQPISNRFMSPKINEKVPYFPMKIMLDKNTGSIHLEKPFPVEEVRPRYDWLTCFEPEDHLNAMVEIILGLPDINKSSVFAGYSFKDDTTLERLKTKNYRNNWRIDPQRDLGVKNPCANIETFQSVFTTAKAELIRQLRGYADVIIVRHVVEHAYDLPGFISAISALTHPDGYIVWELPDCESALAQGDCTTVWEEHIHYFTSYTFKQMLLNAGFNIIYFESVPYPLENSLVAITQKTKQNNSNVLSNNNEVEKECKRAYQFAQKVNVRRKNIQAKLRKFKKSNGTIAMFGAGHLSVAFISIMEIEDVIDFVVDDNPNKKGMKMPIGNIAILGSDSLYSKNVGLCLLGLNPQNHPKVVGKHARFTEKGGKFASIFPSTNFHLEKIIC